MASPGGIRQRVVAGPLRCIMVEPDGTTDAEVKLLVVLCHGIEVLGHDLYGLAHHLCGEKRRLVLPEAPHESAEAREEEQVPNVAGLPIDESNTDLPEWRRPLREWWSRTCSGLVGSRVKPRVSGGFRAGMPRRRRSRNACHVLNMPQRSR